MDIEHKSKNTILCLKNKWIELKSQWTLNIASAIVTSVGTGRSEKRRFDSLWGQAGFYLIQICKPGEEPIKPHVR
jgi:hypothetical protein